VISPLHICNLEPTAIHNSGSVPVEMEGYEDKQFKQSAIIEYLNVEKIPPINIHCHMQAVCGDKCVDVNTVRHLVWQFKQEELGDASLFDKAMLEMPVTA
jgi:hypothetical protein